MSQELGGDQEGFSQKLHRELEKLCDDQAAVLGPMAPTGWSIGWLSSGRLGSQQGGPRHAI